jgi:4-diphosphocytidyl-2-C-methyl-D-erythritol kinase
MGCVVVTPEVGVATPKAFAEWDRKMALTAKKRAELRSGGQPRAAVPTQSQMGGAGELTLPLASDRMVELGRGLSAWLSENYSGAPSDFLARGGRAENPLLRLVRAGIENDFERVVFPEYPELSSVKKTLLRTGAKYASLSGSGSALYGLFGSRVEAAKAAGRLRTEGWSAWATVTLTRAQYWRRMVAG